MISARHVGPKSNKTQRLHFVQRKQELKCYEKIRFLLSKIKELGTLRAGVKVRKSCVQMTLPMIRFGPKLHQMTSELWDSIIAIQNPYPLVR